MLMEHQTVEWLLFILVFHSVNSFDPRIISAPTPCEMMDGKQINCVTHYDINDTDHFMKAELLTRALNRQPEKNGTNNISEPLHNHKQVPALRRRGMIPRAVAIKYNNKKVVTLFKDSSVDALVDFVIDMVKKEIIKKGMDQIKIPDIHETFHKRIGFIKVKGSFDAENGWFRSLSSLYRSQEVSASRSGNILTITAGVGLKEMVIGYNQYKARFEHIGPKGHIKGEVDHNAIEVKLAVDISGSHCKVTLAGARFTQFSKLKIHLTGLGKLSWITSKVVTWVTNKFKSKIIHSAEDALSKSLESVLGRIHCYAAKRGPF